MYWKRTTGGTLRDQSFAVIPSGQAIIFTVESIEHYRKHSGKTPAWIAKLQIEDGSGQDYTDILGDKTINTDISGVIYVPASSNFRYTKSGTKKAEKWKTNHLIMSLLNVKKGKEVKDIEHSEIEDSTAVKIINKIENSNVSKERANMFKRRFTKRSNQRQKEEVNLYELMKYINNKKLRGGSKQTRKKSKHKKHNTRGKNRKTKTSNKRTRRKKHQKANKTRSA